MQLVTWDDDSVLDFVDPAAAEGLDERRRALLHAIGGDGASSFGGSKPCLGPLSPGCRACGEGRWSCLFLNAVCNARCFFCPGGMTHRDALPHAERTSFPSPDAYACYVERLGFGGVAFSGGEPFLTFDRFHDYLRGLRDRLGSAPYLWAYTNGLAARPDQLAAAVEAGLDEVRFDIAACDYDLDPVRAAVGVVPRVSVEIPAIPEDAERVKHLLPDLAAAGVDHLHLHQLMLTGDNGPRLVERPYTFVRTAPPAVVESELAALEVLAHAAAEGIDLPVQYCSLCFKSRWQGRTEDLRAGPHVMRGPDALTAAGRVRRITVRASHDAVAGLGDHLRRRDLDPVFWEVAPSGTSLTLHPSLLPHLPPACDDLHLTWYKVVVGDREEVEWARRSPDYRDLELGPELTIGVALAPLCAPMPVPRAKVEALLRGESGAFAPFEEIPTGLPDYGC